MNIYRRDTTTSAFPLIATLPADTTSFTDTGLTPGTEHEYSIRTFNLGGFSGPANLEITLLTLAPTGLTAVSGFGTMQLNWTAPIGADTYNIYRSTSPDAEGTTPYATGVATNSFQDTGLTGGTVYYYRVSAVDDGGESCSPRPRPTPPTSRRRRSARDPIPCGPRRPCPAGSTIPTRMPSSWG